MSAQAIGPVDVYGELTVKGQYFVGSKNPYTNAMVQVKGLSFFWNQWGGEAYWTADVVDQMVDEYNAEILRVAVSTSGAGRSADLKWAIEVIDQCIVRGVYIIIDFHSHQAWDEIPEAKAFFKEAVEKYGEYDNLIFEIFNEPITESPHEWAPVKEYADEIIGHIRDLGSDNLILVGTPSWCQVYDGIKENPVNDPANNSAYVMHFYAYSHFVDDGGMGENFKNALEDGLPFLVSEWGVSHYNGGRGEFSNSFDGESADEWHALLDKYGFSSAMWAINSDSQSSSLWGNEGQGDRYITNLLAEWKNIADWRTGTVRALPGQFLAAVADVIVEAPATSVVVESLLSGGKAPYTYEWTKLSGSAIDLNNSSTEILTIKELEIGDYRLKLNVADADGVAAETDFLLSVVEPPLSSQESGVSSSEATVSSSSETIAPSSSPHDDTNATPSSHSNEYSGNDDSSMQFDTPPLESSDSETSNLVLGYQSGITTSLIYRITNNAQIPIEVVNAGRYTLRMHDVLGKQVAVRDMKFLAIGSHTLTLDLSIDEGLYVVFIEKYL